MNETLQPTEIELYNGQGWVKLVNHMGTDSTPMYVANKCYGDKKGRTPETDFNEVEKPTRHMIEHKHKTPLEFCELHFIIKVPLFVRAQIIRHRTFNYQEVSNRYTEGKDKDFFIPEEFRGKIEDGNEYCKLQIQHAITTCLTVYNELRDAGVVKEQARMVLPQNMMTELHIKGDLNNMINFWIQRCGVHAQKETQEVANAMLDLAEQVFPGIIDIVKQKILHRKPLKNVEETTKNDDK